MASDEQYNPFALDYGPLDDPALLPHTQLDTLTHPQPEDATQAPEGIAAPNVSGDALDATSIEVASAVEAAPATALPIAAQSSAIAALRPPHSPPHTSATHTHSGAQSSTSGSAPLTHAPVQASSQPFATRADASSTVAAAASSGGAHRADAASTRTDAHTHTHAHTRTHTHTHAQSAPRTHTAGAPRPPIDARDAHRGYDIRDTRDSRDTRWRGDAGYVRDDTHAHAHAHAHVQGSRDVRAAPAAWGASRFADRPAVDPRRPANLPEHAAAPPWRAESAGRAVDPRRQGPQTGVDDRTRMDDRSPPALSRNTDARPHVPDARGLHSSVPERDVRTEQPRPSRFDTRPDWSGTGGDLRSYATQGRSNDPLPAAPARDHSFDRTWSATVVERRDVVSRSAATVAIAQTTVSAVHALIPDIRGATGSGQQPATAAESFVTPSWMAGGASRERPRPPQQSAQKSAPSLPTAVTTMRPSTSPRREWPDEAPALDVSQEKAMSTLRSVAALLTPLVAGAQVTRGSSLTAVTTTTSDAPTSPSAERKRARSSSGGPASHERRSKPRRASAASTSRSTADQRRAKAEFREKLASAVKRALYAYYVPRFPVDPTTSKPAIPAELTPLSAGLVQGRTEFKAIGHKVLKHVAAKLEQQIVAKRGKWRYSRSKHGAYVKAYTRSFIKQRAAAKATSAPEGTATIDANDGEKAADNIITSEAVAATDEDAMMNISDDASEGSDSDSDTDAESGGHRGAEDRDDKFAAEADDIFAEHAAAGSAAE